MNTAKSPSESHLKGVLTDVVRVDTRPGIEIYCIADSLQQAAFVRPRGRGGHACCRMSATECGVRRDREKEKEEAEKAIDEELEDKPPKEK